jgi:hypothetical protein
MKKALWLAGCCVLAGTATFTARADGIPAKPIKDPAAINPTTGAAITGPSDALNTPAPIPSGNVGVVPSALPAPDLTAPIDFSTPIDLANVDPEQIAQATLQKSRDNQEQNQDEQQAEDMRERQQIAAQHDWMLRDYQDRLRKSGLMKSTPDDQSPDGIEAAKAPAGATPNFADDPLLPQNAAPEARPKTDAAEPDASDDADKKNTDSLLGPIALPPLLPPLNSPNNPSSPTHDYFGGSDDANRLSADAPPPGPLPAPPAGATPRDSDTLLDVPGLTAAQQVGMPSEDTSSALDERLPDEPAADTAQARPDQNDFMLPTAPTNDIDSFYKKQAAALAPPTAPTVQPPPALALPKPYVPPEITAKPVIDGLRNHVADPFDFLNR